MTQLKTTKDLQQERMQHYETLCMQAAARVIRDHHLQGDFGMRLRQIARHNGHKELVTALSANRGAGFK